MKKMILVLIVVLIIVSFSGCTSIDPEAMVMANPLVAEFLANHTNTQIRIITYSGDEISSVSNDFKNECNTSYVPSTLAKVEFADLDTGLSLYSWVNTDSMSIICSIQSTRPPANSTYCIEHSESDCFDGHIYWYDTCGYRQEIKLECSIGCERAACLSESGCSSHTEAACNLGHVYWFDSCGNREEKIAHCTEGCDKGRCINSGYGESCIENDDGMDVFTKSNSTVGSYTMVDTCNRDGTLSERYCSGDKILLNRSKCPDGYTCSEGACINQTENNDNGIILDINETELNNSNVTVPDFGNDTACEENWMCSEWSQCINETQTRTCEDENDCDNGDVLPSQVKDCVPGTCEEENGYTCENAEQCNAWLDVPNTKNCCSHNCIVNIVPAGTYMECQNITDGNFDNLISSQHFSIVPYNYNFGMVTFGMIAESGWQSFYPKFTEKKKLAIMPGDITSGTESIYEGGQLSFKCDNELKIARIPSFTDIPEWGFISEEQIYFDSLLFIGKDGTTYYDKELTKIAARALDF